MPMNKNSRQREIPKEFIEQVSDILSSQEFLSLDTYSHHPGASRLVHSMNVSYLAWKMAKRWGYDERSAARTGLLHDFCPYDFADRTPTGEHQAFFHPKAAVCCSREHFHINSKEEQAILTHMFPIGPVPRSRLGWIVTLADKQASVLEVCGVTVVPRYGIGLT